MTPHASAVRDSHCRCADPRGSLLSRAGTLRQSDRGTYKSLMFRKIDQSNQSLKRSAKYESRSLHTAHNSH